MTRSSAGGRFASLLSSSFSRRGRRRRNTARRSGGAFRPLRLEIVEPRTLLASISGTVLDDLTGNGFTPDDTVRPDSVTLELLRDDNTNGQPDDAVLATTTSNPLTGRFSFGGLAAGTYFVRAQLPPNTTQTAGPAYYTVTLASTSQVDAGRDFGFFTPARVTGTKTLDVDGDAQGEVPQAGVTITLYRDQNNDKQYDPTEEVHTEQTDANGQYSFDNLVNGLYFIVEEVPSGFVAIGQTVYSFEVVNNVPYAAGSLPIDNFDDPASAKTYAITALDTDPFTLSTNLTDWQRDLLVDVIGTAGVTSASGAIGAGTYDFGSNGTAGTTATLTYTAASSVDLTDGGANTSVRFDLDLVETGVGEPDLTFSVELTDDDGDTATFAGAIPNNPSSPSTYVAPFSAFTKPLSFSFAAVDEIVIALNNPVQPNVDFILDSVVAVKPQDEGFDFVNACANSRLSGFVYVDTNDNGIKDPAELPIPNTTVTLIGFDVYGNAVNQVTTTDALGFYEFTGLVAGTYTVIETQPAAYLPGKATPGTLGGTASPDGNVIADVVFTICGQNSQQNNFGELGLEHPSKQVLLFPFGLWATPTDADGQGDVQISGVTEIAGTDGDDTLVYDARTGQGTLTTGAGQVQTFNALNTTLHFNAGQGVDTVEIVGSAGDEMLVLKPDSAHLVGPDYAVTLFSAEQITVDGSGGADAAFLSDSSGNDEYRAGRGHGWLIGTGFSHYIKSFETQYAESTAGGSDTGWLYDSAGDDVYTAMPRQASLAGGGFEMSLDGFSEVHAYASNGGNDEAYLNDSAGDDNFVGARSESSLWGNNFYNRAKFFEAVYATGTQGFDIARLFDSPGNDSFEAGPTQAVLQGDGFRNQVDDFDVVHGYSTVGGYDVASLSDSAGDDHLLADATATSLWNSTYYLRAKLFEEVYAEADQGNDTVEIRDSNGDDYLWAQDDFAQMWWYGTQFFQVLDFDVVTAISSLGGTDRAYYQGPATVDYLMTLTGPWIDW